LTLIVLNQKLLEKNEDFFYILKSKKITAQAVYERREEQSPASFRFTFYYLYTIFSPFFVYIYSWGT